MTKLSVVAIELADEQLVEQIAQALRQTYRAAKSEGSHLTALDVARIAVRVMRTQPTYFLFDDVTKSLVPFTPRAA